MFRIEEILDASLNMIYECRYVIIARERERAHGRDLRVGVNARP